MQNIYIIYFTNQNNNNTRNNNNNNNNNKSKPLKNPVNKNEKYKSKII